MLHRRNIKPTRKHRFFHLPSNTKIEARMLSVPSGVMAQLDPYSSLRRLNCWEHLQLLLRYYEYSQGVQIHVAGWRPFFNHLSAPWPYHVLADAETVACQNMAMEGVCFVLIATQVLTEKNHKLTKTGGQLFFKGVE